MTASDTCLASYIVISIPDKTRGDVINPYRIREMCAVSDRRLFIVLRDANPAAKMGRRVVNGSRLTPPRFTRETPEIMTAASTDSSFPAMAIGTTIQKIHFCGVSLFIAPRAKDGVQAGRRHQTMRLIARKGSRRSFR
jgi:hypothetical protein